MQKSRSETEAANSGTVSMSGRTGLYLYQYTTALKCLGNRLGLGAPMLAKPTTKMKPEMSKTLVLCLIYFISVLTPLLQDGVVGELDELNVNHTSQTNRVCARRHARREGIAGGV